MSNFLGEYDVKLDDKGRLKLPAALKRQVSPEANGRFVVNRGFETCLVLYPWNEWEKISARVGALNTFVKKNREFVRIFYRGATEVSLDATDRVNIPNSLLQYAGIKREILLSARNNLIELWNKDTYNGLMSVDSDSFADLAEDVLGDLSNLNPNIT